MSLVSDSFSPVHCHPIGCWTDVEAFEHFADLQINDNYVKIRLYQENIVVSTTISEYCKVFSSFNDWLD